MAWDIPEPVGLALLLAVGVAAGFLNTLAGGGSLITVPVLMLFGLSPHVANGTNRVSVLATSVFGAWGFERHGVLDRRQATRIAAPTVAGALLGAFAASRMPSAVLRPALIAALVAVAVVLVARPKVLVPDLAAGETPRALTAVSASGLFLIGAYGGFAQAGVGIFLLAYLGGVLRFDLVRGNAVKSVLVAVFTCVALAVFVSHGHVEWFLGLVLSAGTAAGSWLAVRTAMVKGQEWVRRILLVVVLALCAAALMGR